MKVSEKVALEKCYDINKVQILNRQYHKTMLTEVS